MYVKVPKTVFRPKMGIAEISVAENWGCGCGVAEKIFGPHPKFAKVFPKKISWSYEHFKVIRDSRDHFRGRFWIILLSDSQ